MSQTVLYVDLTEHENYSLLSLLRTILIFLNLNVLFNHMITEKNLICVKSIFTAIGLYLRLAVKHPLTVLNVEYCHTIREYMIRIESKVENYCKK